MLVKLINQDRMSELWWWREETVARTAETLVISKKKKIQIDLWHPENFDWKWESIDEIVVIYLESCKISNCMKASKSGNCWLEFPKYKADVKTEIFLLKMCHKTFSGITKILTEPPECWRSRENNFGFVEILTEVREFCEVVFCLVGQADVMGLDHYRESAWSFTTNLSLSLLAFGATR